MDESCKGGPSGSRLQFFPQTVMNLAEELTLLCRQVKKQEKEIRRFKGKNEFLEEASAFFTVSRRKSARDRE